MTKLTKRLKEAYKVKDELRDIDSKMRIHRKIDTALPKKKHEIQQRILTSLGIKSFNAQSRLVALERKMTKKEKDQLEADNG